MQNGLYVSLSAQVALEQRLETIADNVANMNTVGYRGTGVSFETEMAKAGDARLGYVSNGSDFISRRLGGLIKTDNTLDVAVQGDGWFGIQTPQGVAYTRDGRMKIDELGMLRTLNGNPILDAGGAPILLDSGAGPLAVSADGMITQNGRQIGALGLFEIDPDRQPETSGKLERHAGQAGDAGPRFHPRWGRSGRGRRLERRSDAGDDQTDRGDERLRRGRGRDLAVRDVASRRDQDSRGIGMTRALAQTFSRRSHASSSGSRKDCGHFRRRA